MKGPLLITGFLIVGLAGSRELPRTSPDVVIYEGRYPGWPWIAAGDDDAFYCVFREGTIHGYSADGSVMFTKSTDRGRSWSPARVIADAPEVDDRNAAIVVLRGGELLLGGCRLVPRCLQTCCGLAGTLGCSLQNLDLG